MNFLKNIFDICFLRGRVQDLPASMQLLAIVALLDMVVNSLGMPGETIDLAPVLFIASQVILFGVVIALLLKFRGFGARWMQTITALYAVDALFSLLLLPFLPALVQLLKQGEEAKAGWEGLVLVVLGGWLLLVVAWILREATEWSLPLAFLAGLTSLLAVRMLGYILLPLFGMTAQT